MIRFRWLPACLLAMLMTAGVCWGQKQMSSQTAQSTDTTRLPYYYELVDVLFPATTGFPYELVDIQGGISILNTDNQEDSADNSADECNDECCDDCAAEWIPILVDDCMRMWTLFWELGSYKEAAHLADEAWRLDPCNIATMHARTLSHIALALNVKPTGECQAQPANALRDLASLNTTWQVTNMGCGGFAISCSGPTGPATTCTLPTNACGMGCANASGCAGPCTTSCQPAKPTACEACSDCSAACTGSTCAATACCDQPTACGTSASTPCSKACGHGCSASCSSACKSCCSEAKCCSGCCACKCACAKDCKCCCKTACAKDCKCCCSGKCCCAKNTCACQEAISALLDRIIALMTERDSKAANVLVLPPGVAPHPMMAMPGMPGMCVPPPPPPMAPAGQPVCMPGMPCPAMPASRLMEAAAIPQPIPRAPVPPGAWVVGEMLANPPMIPVRKDDMPIHVTPHGKRIHVSCKGFEAQCDSLTTCDGGERLVLEGKVRLTMQTGNKPGKVSAERVEVFVPEGSVELVPDCTIEKPVEPVHYECNPVRGLCPVCPPASYGQ